MRKYLFITFLATFFLFASMKIDASSTLTLKENSNGNINALITFDEGYVGGIEAIIKYTGNVSFDHVDWNSALNDYSKSYFEKDGEIHLIITAGNPKVNLLNNYGVLDFGNLVFSNSNNESQSYSFTLTSIQIVDLNLKSSKIEDIATDSNSFTLSYKEKEEKPSVTPDKDDNKDNTGNGDNQNNDNDTNTPPVDNEPNDTGSNTNGNTGNNQNNNTTGSDNVQNNQENNNENNGEDNTLDNENKDDEKDDNVIEIDGTKNDKKENKDDSTQNKNGILKFLLIGVVAIFSLGIIVSLINARKSNKLGKM